MNRVNKNKIKITELLFYIFYSVVIFRYLIMSYINISIEFSDKIFIIVLIPISFSIIYFKKYNINELINTFIIIIISIIITYYSKQPTILITTITIILSKDIEFKKIVRYDMYLKGYIVFFTVLFSVLGIIENIKLIRYEASSIIIRNSYGFTHPNILATMILLIIIDYIYINHSKFRLKNYIFVILVMGITNIITDSRTGLYIIIVVLIIILLDNSCIFSKRIITYLSSIIIPCMGIGSIIAAIYYSKNILFQWIDLILTGRIRLANIYLNIYPIKIFGTEMEFLSNTYKGEIITLDNLYVRIMLNFGVLYFVLICLSYYKLGRRYRNSLNSKKSILIITFALLGMCESMGYNICFNISLFLIIELIYNSNRKNRKFIKVGKYGTFNINNSTSI